MTTTNKLYPFSIQKHAHDIEFYRNRLFNIMHDMESGEIPMDTKRYNRIMDMYEGALEELYDAVRFSTRDGHIAWLTGAQISLAKRIVFWASNERATACEAAGRTDLIQYC